MKVRVIILPFILSHFSFASNATNFFIHLLNRFTFKRVTGFPQTDVLYVNIRHDPWSEYN